MVLQPKKNAIRWLINDPWNAFNKAFLLLKRVTKLLFKYIQFGKNIIATLFRNEIMLKNAIKISPLLIQWKRMIITFLNFRILFYKWLGNLS